MLSAGLTLGYYTLTSYGTFHGVFVALPFQITTQHVSVDVCTTLMGASLRANHFAVLVTPEFYGISLFNAAVGCNGHLA